ncbi:hypothetical protein EVAR_53846_1 [Eumeta japonica]|uniref:Uncharacterized protein n=1 Tax=Eumeta variegata TaxID=151549 RepID=A0A4C1XF84_EUMVA|nr:hypothetical protein EVAR_53846_1 [Eumeta japonica]
MKLSPLHLVISTLSRVGGAYDIKNILIRRGTTRPYLFARKKLAARGRAMREAVTGLPRVRNASLYVMRVIMRSRLHYCAYDFGRRNYHCLVNNGRWRSSTRTRPACELFDLNKKKLSMTEQRQEPDTTTRTKNTRRQNERNRGRTGVRPFYPNVRPNWPVCLAVWFGELATLRAPPAPITRANAADIKTATIVNAAHHISRDPILRGSAARPADLHIATYHSPSGPRAARGRRGGVGGSYS